VVSITPRPALPLGNNLALTIYKTLVRPIITYAAPVCGNAAKTHLSKLQVSQNKALRTIINLPRVTPIKILQEDDRTPCQVIRTKVIFKNLSVYVLTNR
jgi:hypothetical protein